MSARCRLLGHRWSFGVEGSDVVWTCTRCHDAGGRRRYPDERQARFHAAYFDHAAPKPPGPFLAAFGGLVPRSSSERDRRG
jgi:hypothetical protein